MRAIASSVVLVLAAILLVLSTFAVWVDRVALNTDVFVDTSSELIEDDVIRQAVATRAVDELFDSVDVNAEIKAQLPEDFKNLSGPATAGAARGVVHARRARARAAATPATVGDDARGVAPDARRRARGRGRVRLDRRAAR